MTNQQPTGSPYARRRPTAGLLSGFLGVLALVLGAFLVVELIRDDDGGVTDVGVTVSDVASNPEQYEDERVVVSGVVRDRITDRLITIGDEELLVLLAAANDVPEDAVAQVDGTVTRMTATSIEGELGAIPEDHRDRLGSDGGDVFVLRASAMLLNPFQDDDDAMEGSDAAATPTETLEDELDDEGALDAPGVLSVGDVTDRIDELEGQQVTIGGALSVNLTEHVSSFAGDVYEADDLLLVSDRTAPGTALGAVQARATGTLVTFNRDDIEQRMGIELDEDLVSDYEGRPTLLADSIHFFMSSTNAATQLENLAATPDEEGWTVTVTGTVSEVISDGVFRLNDDVWIAGATGDTAPLEGALARVTGTVAMYDAEASDQSLQDALGDLSEDERGGIEGRPVILAEDVQFVR
ncbi:MAG: hypothetical protein WD800_05505 [Dehalococcoidia bacterium]